MDDIQEVLFLPRRESLPSLVLVVSEMVEVTTEVTVSASEEVSAVAVFEIWTTYRRYFSYQGEKAYLRLFWSSQKWSKSPLK